MTGKCAPIRRLTIEAIAELGPVADKIPQHSLSRHTAVCSDLAKLILDFAAQGQTEREEELTRFFLYCHCYLLRSEGSGSRGKQREHKRYSAVEREIKQIRDAEQNGQASTGLPHVKSEQPTDKLVDPVLAAVRRANHMMSLKLVSKAAKALLQRGLADPSDPAVLAKVRELHPTCDDSMPLCPPGAPVIISREQIRAQLKKMSAKGSAPGLSKMSSRHLLPLSEQPNIMNLITHICNRIANAEYSDQMRPFFMDSLGLLPQKPGGGVRPLAIGDTVYRLTAQIVLALDRSQWKEAAGPRQLGAGVTAGCEALSTLVQNGLDEGFAAIHIDSKNAFNTRSRRKILDTCLSNPYLVHSHKLLWLKYGKPTRIFYLGKRGSIVAQIESQQGVGQGDPLGTDAHDASMKDDLEEAAYNNPDVEIWALHDDVWGIGAPDKLPQFFDDYVKIAARSNTEVQPAKSECAYFDSLPLSQSFQTWAQQRGVRIETKAIEVAGAIVAQSDETAAELIADHLWEHEQMFKKIAHPQLSRQNGQILIRASAQAKMSYTGRATRTPIIPNLLASFDEMVLEGWADKCDLGQLSAQESLDAWLPFSLSGHGLRSQREIAPFAWFAAQAQMAPILVKSRHGTSRKADAQRQAVMNSIRELMTGSKANLESLQAKLPPETGVMNTWFSQDSSRSEGLQAELSRLLKERNYNLATQNLSNLDTARREANASEEGRKFWTTLPTTPGTTLTDADFATIVKLKLGRKSTEAPLPDHCPRCSQPLGDSVPDSWHPDHCQSNAPTAFNARHNACAHVLTRRFDEHHIPYHSELRPACDESKDRRRMDIVWYNGAQETWVDMTIRDLQCPTRRYNPAGTLKHAEAEKIRKYKDLAKERNATVMPFAMNGFGQMGECAKKVVAMVTDFTVQNGLSKQSAREFRGDLLSEMVMTHYSHTARIVNTQINGLAMMRAESDRAAQLLEARLTTLMPLSSLPLPQSSLTESKRSLEPFDINVDMPQAHEAEEREHKYPTAISQKKSSGRGYNTAFNQPQQPSGTSVEQRDQPKQTAPPPASGPTPMDTDSLHYDADNDCAMSG